MNVNKIEVNYKFIATRLRTDMIWPNDLFWFQEIILKYVEYIETKNKQALCNLIIA